MERFNVNPMYSLLFATLLNTACGMPLLRRDPVDNSAGASGGDQGAYSLSTGGLVAIIVVIVLVVLLGIASITLFIVAKRRQWKIRYTIKHASRKMASKVDLRQSRPGSRGRGAVQIRSQPQTPATPAPPKNKDLEKKPVGQVGHTMEVEDPGKKEKETKLKAMVPEGWSIGRKK